ncbi:MAG: type 1 glutamine amidotransferase [Hyphomicrobiales bacterium]
MMRAVVLQHLDGEGPGLLGDFLREYEIAYDCVMLNRGETIPLDAGHDLMLVMGASQQVWQEDKFPWLKEEKRAIRQWVEDLGKPYFGVCFGHQLLAEVMGGAAGPAEHDELGLIKVTATQAAAKDDVFSVFPETSRWVQWHTAEVTAPPKGASVLAKSANCAVQAMSLGTSAVSIQFHAEATVERVDSWLTMRECIEDMEKMRGEGAHERFIADARKYLPEANHNSRKLFTRFLEINGLIPAERTQAAE